MAMNLSNQINGVFKKLITDAENLDGLRFESSGQVIGPNFSIEILSPPDTGPIMGLLEEAHERGVAAVAEGLKDHLKAQIIAVGAVETGALMNSGSVAFHSDSINIDYSISPYAALIHYGGYIAPYGNVNIEKVYIPGRPWLEASLGISPGPLGAFNWKEAYTVGAGSSLKL